MGNVNALGPGIRVEPARTGDGSVRKPVVRATVLPSRAGCVVRWATVDDRPFPCAAGSCPQRVEAAGARCRGHR